MHLVGFITRIYHDARSPERQTRCLLYVEDILVKVKTLHIEYRFRWSSGRGLLIYNLPLNTPQNKKQ